MNNLNIFVTGADGFIGSHLIEKLISLKCKKIEALTYYNSLGSWGWLEGIKNENLQILSGDIRDFHFINKSIKDCDIIFHLAALIGIPFSYDSSDLYIQTNIQGTKNILEAARLNKVKKVIITSTSEVYGKALKFPITENCPLVAASPYSATKIAAEKMAEAFYLSFNLPVAIARPFNTYGPRQSARAIIPTIISQIVNGSKKINLGYLNSRRDFSYVADTVQGLIKIAESRKTIGEIINICSCKDISMKELYFKIKKKMMSKSKILIDKKRIRPKNSEVLKLLGSNYKLKKLTKWKQEISLDSGLNKTIDWFLKNKDKYKPDNYNI
jgi:dTDP-glucose 4,6-dehydratase